MATIYPIGGADTPLDVYSARDLGAHHGAATSVAWSCSAHRLASGGVDGCVKIWAPDKTRPSFNANLQQQQQQSQQQSQSQHAERPVGEIRLPSSTSRASASSSAAAPSSRSRPPRVNRLAWHPRLQEILAVASDDGATVRLFDARTGEAASRASSGSHPPSSSSSSSGGPRFVASYAPPSPMPRCAAISLAWCPGGSGSNGRRENLIAVGSDADVISFFDASSGKLLALLPPPSPGTEVNEAVFSSDGKVFARAVGTHGAVELFSVEELLERNGGGGGATSPPPPSTASDWKHLRCPARPFATLQGHTSTVFALSTVAIAAGAGGTGGGSSGGGPASFLLASGGADGAAVVWDLRRAAPLATCGAFDHQVKSVSLGGGWRGPSAAAPPSSSGASAGSPLLAYSGEGDTIVVEDWTLAAATGGFLPPRAPTAPRSGAAPSPRPYPFRVYVPRVESVAWAPAAVSNEAAAPSSAAAGSAPSNDDGNPSSPRSASSTKRSHHHQSNVGALAFTRCIPAAGSAQQQHSGGRGGEVVGAVGLFAPPVPVAAPKR